MENTSLGEFELIARLTAGLQTRSDIALGVGDDCTILDIGSKELLLATCDSQVEGVHFTLETSTPEQIGRKALAINLSDIAAMGGTPRFALVSLMLPSTLSVETLDGIYAGLRKEGEHFETAIVGGNIAATGKSEGLVIDITLLGTVARGHAITRSGGRAGDVLCVTGSLGDAAGGLHTLLSPDPDYPAEAQEYLRAISRVPRPRVHEGQVLSGFRPEIVTAMLDISDGLSGDLTHLCDQSNVGVQLDLARIPLSPALRTLASAAQRDPLDWALHGGEDYELLFTVSPPHAQEVAQAVQNATGTPVSFIGNMLATDEGRFLLSSDGGREQLVVKSWDHLKH